MTSRKMSQSLSASPLPAWGVLLSSVTLLVGAACDRTVAGVKEDTRAASTAAGKTADDATRKLDSEVAALKAETSAKLERLSVAVESLEAKAGNGLDESKEKLKAQIAQTRAQLSTLKADSSAELQQAKTDLDDKVSKLGKSMHEGLGKVGDKVDDALH